MRPARFDLDMLRGFVLGLDLGSFARAAERQGLSTSAISAQLKKLEGEAGTALVRKTGRHLEATPAGETLLAYARRLIDLHDEAALAVRGAALAGAVALGVQEDFGAALLPGVLARFARAHPQVQLETRIGRNADLIAAVRAGKLDFALVWDAGGDLPHRRPVATLPVCWIAAAGSVPAAPVSLVVLDETCWFRNTGIAALTAAARPWRLALTSAGLAGVWAGVAAHLGLTVRTHLGLPPGLTPLDAAAHGLPALPMLGLSLIRRAETLPAPAATLANLVAAAVAEHAMTAPAHIQSGSFSSPL